MAAAVVAGMVGFADPSPGAAIVGPMRQVSVEHRAAEGIDGMKAEYRRPALIPFPDENRFTPAKAALGKTLYFDPRLSAASSVSCASCHSPGFGWGDGMALGSGNDTARLARRSPTVVNSAWGEVFMWDGRAASLEQQALGPIQSAYEMNMPIDRLMRRLASIGEYRLLFTSTFPGRGITPATLAEALATYERTIVSERSPFDAWIEGDAHAISEQAKRGFAIFNTKGRCSSCHEGWNFTNDGFHDIGLPGADIGRAALLPKIPGMAHAFKTPGLREIERRGPYMHDGSIATLEGVIEHYDGGGVDRPTRSELIGPLGLEAQEKADLIAFLKTLTGSPSPTMMPVFPR
jgi:cytochrome c peroxidase